MPLPPLEASVLAMKMFKGSPFLFYVYCCLLCLRNRAMRFYKLSMALPPFPDPWEDLKWGEDCAVRTLPPPSLFWTSRCRVKVTLRNWMSCWSITESSSLPRKLSPLERLKSKKIIPQTLSPSNMWRHRVKGAGPECHIAARHLPAEAVRDASRRAQLSTSQAQNPFCL